MCGFVRVESTNLSLVSETCLEPLEVEGLANSVADQLLSVTCDVPSGLQATSCKQLKQQKSYTGVFGQRLLISAQLLQASFRRVGKLLPLASWRVGALDFRAAGFQLLAASRLANPKTI